MPAGNVKVEIPDLDKKVRKRLGLAAVGEIYVTPAAARKMKRTGDAVEVSREPYVLRLCKDAAPRWIKVSVWSRRSDVLRVGGSLIGGYAMMGSSFSRAGVPVAGVRSDES